MLALYIVAGILLVIVLAFSIPVNLSFNFRTDVAGQRMLRVGWLFGLVEKNLLPRKKKLAKKPRKTKKRDLKTVLTLIRTRGVLTGIIRLVRRILKSLRVRQLNADLRVGLDDPADTGIMYAVLWPLMVRPNLFGPVTSRIEPVFEEPVFEAALQGEVTIVPAQMVANLLRSIFSPTGLRVVKVMVVSRWKRKR
ncbi:MAG: DUF2953 domain-containing protein [Dehalococcoidales bacterium]|nr:MAG: DUF2953 domain-containing protein [Dehalococcoidales bacterium]